MKLQLTQINVKTLLAEYPHLKAIENRMEAIWIYYTIFEGITDTITKKEWLVITNPETVSRAIRKEVNPELGERDTHQKKRIQKSFGNFYKNS